MKKIQLKFNRNQFLKGLGLVLLGLLLGWLVFGGNKDAARNNELETSHVHSTTESDLWTCAMHPQIQQDHPGNCPICGMELIPLSNEMEGEVMAGELQMNEASMRIADIQTTEVRSIAPMKELFLTGKIKADESRISELTARFPGRIEHLYINYTGQRVSKGQKLATVYSPELITAQKELFEAIKLKELSPQMYAAARSKLRLWNLTDSQIDELEQSTEPKVNFDIFSPLSGTVTMRHSSLGDYVREGTPMFEIIDLRRVWVMFDGYESDLGWIKVGDQIAITVQSIPGKPFSSKVTFIDPVIDPTTRVAYIRAELSNPGQVLKPDMFVRGRISSMLPGKKEALVVPKSAVLWTGKRAVVYTKSPNRVQPTFAYKEITLGEAVSGYYVVVDGLEAGEEVVTNGAFKIDAAAQLLGKPSMMNPEGGKTSTGHNHGDSGDEKKTDSQDHSGHSEQEGNMKEMPVNPTFQRQLTQVINTYLELNESLIASDSKAAGKNAQLVKSALGQTDMSLLKGDAHNQWMALLTPLQSALKSIQETADLAEQRAAFAKLGDLLYTSVKQFDLKGQTLYYQYCPMAVGNQGAYWLSANKEIRNPYFGEAMLTCGETKETLQ